VAFNASATLPSIKLQAASDTGTLGDGITANNTPTLTANGAVVGVNAGDTLQLFNGATVLGTTTAGTGGVWAVRPSRVLDDSTYTLTVNNLTQNTTVGIARKI
jgi:hypothetical protein